MLSSNLLSSDKEDPADETLLLRLRSESLKHNLGRVHQLWKDLPELRKDLAALDANVAESKAALLENVRELLRVQEVGLSGSIDPNTLFDAIGRLQKNVLARFTGLQKEIQSVRSKSFLVEEKSIGEQAGEALKQRADTVLSTLKRLTADGPNKNDWARFRKAEKTSANIFHECIDMLGGMVLRDAQFEPSLWQLADELLGTYEPRPKLADDGKIRALPIAGGLRTVVTRLERVVRLRFPEWNIWALPFTAYSFWDVAARAGLKEKLIQSLGEDEGDPDTLGCLADAFATYTAGPAYAFAAFTLQLNPAVPVALESASTWLTHEGRARTILLMLQRMNGSDSVQPPSFEGPRSALEAAWAAAKRQAGGKAAITPETQARIERIVSTLVLELKDKGCVPFTLDQWRSCYPLKDKLFSDSFETEKQSLPAGTEVRSVLNAGWLARRTRKRGFDLPRLTERVNDLLGEVRAFRENSQGGPFKGFQA